MAFMIVGERQDESYDSVDGMKESDEAAQRWLLEEGIPLYIKKYNSNTHNIGSQIDSSIREAFNRKTVSVMLTAFVSPPDTLEKDRYQGNMGRTFHAVR